ARDAGSAQTSLSLCGTRQRRRRDPRPLPRCTGRGRGGATMDRRPRPWGARSRPAPRWSHPLQEQCVSSNVGSISTPLVRGALGALGSLGMALAVVVVPALAAQVAGTASTATSLDAIIIALNILVLGHGGGIMLSTGVIDGAVTLTPFGLLALLLVLAALGMRRVGRALRLVRDDGVLRVRALRDAGGALGAYAVVYAIGVGVLAGIGRSIDTSPMVTSAIVSGAMVAVLGGLAGLLWSVRRDATSTVPGVRVLDLLPAP